MLQLDFHPTGRHFLQIPGPSPVPDRILRAMSLPTIDHRGPEFGALGKKVLGDIGKIFKTKQPVVIYPASGTGAWEAALANVMSPGDEVLMYETGHFASLWIKMATRLGLKPEVLQPGWAPDAAGLPFTEFSFKINEMKLAGLGVLSTGQGGLAFDFSDLTTFAGLPLPSGRLSILTTGAYGLIDLMAKAGQISAEDVQGARAGLLMVGRAGEAPDTLHTELDFREKGLFLNGIKIR